MTQGSVEDDHLSETSEARASIPSSSSFAIIINVKFPSRMLEFSLLDVVKTISFLLQRVFKDI